MTAEQVFEQALDLLDSAKDLSNLITSAIIGIALQPPTPAGSPSRIAGSPAGTGGTALTYGTIGTNLFDTSSDLRTVADSLLPTAWRGQAAESATQATRAVAAQAEAAGVAFSSAFSALTDWGGKLADAQRRDARGQELLRKADGMVMGDGLFSFGKGATAEARALAEEGCKDRLAAAKIITGAASDAADVLNQLAATARARQMNSPDIDPLTSVVLGYSSDTGWTSDPLISITNPNGLARASQALNAMSAADRAAFEKMLANARSPQEAAYLWKALGAGYGLSDVQKFDQVIHPHGDDTKWLSQHLDPHINDIYSRETGNKGQYTVNYAGQSNYDVPVPGKPGYVYRYDFYNQLTNGDKNTGDCVAASTVMARAANDPVFMLGMTTGQGPMAVSGAKVGDDSPKAVHNRLEQNYTSNYNLNKADPTANANTLLKPATGSSYQDVSVHTPEERRAALPHIEAAVDSGKPVPLGVFPTDPKPDKDGVVYGHQVMILAAQGDKLEIYNPWGFTEWVTKQQFIDGQLGELTSKTPTGGLADPSSVELPQ
ncbi:hypothetical protein [Nocardia macrotermitis]|uniref:Uncharacterized protein n=1 Tax=Nocardia macrotermitis TaxID=2585198 RepID=A0A7K0D1B8_9NOCA|nr:hypothetical protein [Nocardia macrotermitis]MQY19513.1 hypothetical protein [Nocardia macrotermitis]